MQKIIYHIHNEICKHSTNKLNEIVAYALKHNYKELYFTEHPPIDKKCFYQRRRATYPEVKNLVNNISKVNKKYKGKLHIYFGYEIEFNKADRSFVRRYKKDPYAQFFIFGNHFYGSIFDIKKLPAPLVMHTTKTLSQLKEFDENNKLGMSSGLMSWVAHPDIFLNSYKKWNKTTLLISKNIIAYAKKYKLPLGFNVNFQSYEKKSEWHYPCIHFWKLVAKTNIPVIIESDAHDMHTLKVEWLEKARQLAISYGLKKNLTENIKLKMLKK